MTIHRMDHVGVVVEDLAAAIAFFVELGLELEGETAVEGEWVDQLVGLDGVRADLAVVRTPDGHGRVELSTFHSPVATGSAPRARVNTPGIPRLTFLVDAVLQRDALEGRLVQPDPHLAVEHGDRGRDRAAGAHRLLDLAGHAHVLGPRQAVGDDRRLQRDDRAPIGDRRRHLVGDPQHQRSPVTGAPRPAR